MEVPTGVSQPVPPPGAMSATTNPDDDDRTVVIKKASDGHENALPPGTRLHEFEIVRLVGEGGFGIVYLAQDSVLQRRVALKEYLPSSLASRGAGLTVHVTSKRHEETFQLGLRSFLNEARLLAQFDHPALVKVYRFWEANGTAYMIMPFYDGATFKQTVQRNGSPDETRLKTLLHQLLEALEVLHGAGCVHRDVAPDNVVMLASSRPVLLDFGAARHVIADRTQALTVILKPGYAPIEQYAQLAGVQQGPWTDVYALAGVAHFAITGSPPPPSIARTLTDPYVPLEQAAAGRYSVEFLRAIDRALAVRPEHRPQTADEFRALLGAAPLVTTATAFTHARTTAALPPRRRMPWHLWIGGPAAIAAALGAGAYFYMKEAVPPAPAPVSAAKGPAKPAPAADATPAPATVPPPAQSRVETAVVAPPAEPEPTLPPPVQAESAPPAAEKAIATPQPKSRAAEAAAKVAKPKPETIPARAEVRAQPAAPKPLALAPSEPPREAPAPGASNQLAAIAAAAIDDGEKCLRAKQYDCAIANANSALRVEPASARAKRLKGDAEDEQRRALSSIKIE